MIEDTVFILKPDAVPHRAAIMEELAARFQIVSLRDFHCDIALSAKLYPDDIGRPIFRGICEYMAEAPCTVGVLRGDDAIAQFFALAGRAAHPDQCAPESLRFRYGAREQRTPSGIVVVKNAVHRPKSAAERDRDLAVLAAFIA